MSVAVQNLLNSFERLADDEKRELALEIIRQVAHIDFPSLIDKELVLNAEAIFLELERSESPNVRTMKKTDSTEPQSDEMLPEYRFDYRKARPNRFAEVVEGSMIVVLEPEIARVFKTQERVKAILRAIADAMLQVQ